MKFKIKHAVILFLIGWAITMVGALFKIQHWPDAGILLTVGTFIRVLAVILFILKLLKNRALKDFLNQ